MTDKNPIIEELKTLRDELRLQAHLFTMEAKEEFDHLEKKLEELFENSAVELGKFNEEFWVGKEDEVKDLIAKLQNLTPKS